jgi:hypothetical protein
VPLASDLASKRRRRARRLGPLAVLGLAGLGVGIGGCGLVSSDILTLTFDLPERHYVFDTATWGLPATAVPAVPCTADATCCSAAALVGYDCAKSPPLVCDTSAGAGVCAVKLPVESPPQTIDLSMQASGLSGVNGQTLASVSISQIAYVIDVNTLNRDLPPISLYLAPQNVASSSDPMAHKFGTVPAIPAMQTTGGTVALEPDAESTFAGYARNFRTPFEFLSHTVVTVRGGDPTPSGRIDVRVRGKVSAKPSL